MYEGSLTKNCAYSHHVSFSMAIKCPRFCLEANLLNCFLFNKTGMHHIMEQHLSRCYLQLETNVSCEIAIQAFLKMRVHYLHIMEPVHLHQWPHCYKCKLTNYLFSIICIYPIWEQVSPFSYGKQLWNWLNVDRIFSGA